MQTIFEFLDYKKYLKANIESRPNEGRGVRSLLAKEIGCQVTYLSRVLNADAHLSAEQAEKANPVLGHSAEESSFFLLLVLHNRAGTRELKERYYHLIHEVLQKRQNLKDRLKFKKELSSENQAIYYSSWHYAAVHMLLGIPEFQKKEVLAKRTGLDPVMVSNILEFLTSVGLAIFENGRFKIGKAQIYLANDSPLISKHHTNWRMQAIRSIDRPRAEDLHYSAVITVSHADSLKIREMFIKTLEQIRPVIRASKDEALFSYALDFFEVR